MSVCVFTLCDTAVWLGKAGRMTLPRNFWQLDVVDVSRFNRSPMFDVPFLRVESLRAPSV